jgi:hypothetical protein
MTHLDPVARSMSGDSKYQSGEHTEDRLSTLPEEELITQYRNAAIGIPRGIVEVPSIRIGR